MFETSFSISGTRQFACNLSRNKKSYVNNTLLSILSYEMNHTDDKLDDSNSLAQINAEVFAEWLREAYRKSHFKSHADLAKAVQVSRTTISRLMNASDQLLTGKPSQPRIELISRLAAATGADETEGLIRAGHIIVDRSLHKPNNLRELIQTLESLGIEQFSWSADMEKLEQADDNPEIFEELLERIKADVGITLKRNLK